MSDWVMVSWYEMLVSWANIYVPRVLQAAIVILIAYLLVKYLDKVVSLFIKAEEHEFINRFIMFLKGIIYSIAILMAISFVAVESQVFVALLLTVGIGIIVMFSDVLRNIGSELYVRNLRVLREGDWVEIDGIQGRVARLTSMGVILETLRRERVFIPYTRIAHTKVVNRMSTYGLSFRVVVRVPKTYDVTKARELVMSSLQGVREDLIAEPSVVLRSITETSYVFDITLDVMNVGKAEKVFSDLLLELKSREPNADVEF